MTNLTLKGSSYRVVNLIVYMARERERERIHREIHRERERYIYIERERYIYIDIDIYRERDLYIYISRVFFPVSLDFLLPGQGKGGGTCLQHAGRQS